MLSDVTLQYKKNLKSSQIFLTIPLHIKTTDIFNYSTCAIVYSPAHQIHYAVIFMQLLWFFVLVSAIQTVLKN